VAGGRKSPYPAKGDKEHGGKAENLRGCNNVVDACLGDFLKALGVPQLPIGAMRSKGVSARTVTF